MTEKTAPPRKAVTKTGLYGKSILPEEERRQYVLFRIAEENYALLLESVQEILVTRGITEVPFTPDHIAGIVNLRGRVVTVVDLRQRLGLPSVKITRASRIVVVDYHAQSIGLMVDSVPAVIFIPTKKIEPVSSLIAGPVRSDFFSGIATLEGAIVIILDLEKTLRRPQGELSVKS